MFVRAGNKYPYLLATLALAGCSAGLSPGNSPLPPTAIVFSGRVMGGQQPVSGAAITLWQVNTTGAAATSMLKTAVTSDANGNFSIAGNYPNASTSCTSTTQVYILATGGNPGLSVGTNNGALALMAALGSCTALQSTTYITINEVTTVDAVFALQQFIGVSEGTPFAEDIATNTTTQSALGMTNAFTTVPNLVSIANGSANSTVGNATMEATKLNTLANILSSCVNSNGTTACQSLFNAVTPSGSIAPGDTIQAALYMAQNPSNNIAGLFALQPATPPFLPDLTTAPYDWSLAATYTSDGLNLPNLLASDASGDIWITDSASSGSEALVELGPNGSPVGSSPFLSGSSVAFDGPQAIVPDTLGNIWISAHSTSSSTGNRLVAYNPTTKAVTAHSGLPSGCDPYALAIDASDNLFFACSALGYLYEYPNLTSGTPSSTNLPTYAISPTQLGALGSESYGMAVDTLGNVWVANTQASGSPSVTEYASGSYSSAANTFTLGSGPVGIAVDHSNNVWAVSSNKLNEYTYSSSGYTAADYTGAGLSTAAYLAIDGNGNIWVANGSPATLSASGPTYVTISEFSNAGLPLTPSISTDVSTGYANQPGGLANATTISSPQPRGLTIDPSGNVWIAGCGASGSCSSTNGSFVMEFIGVASPPIVPLSTAIANNQLGCCGFIPVAPSGTSPTDTAGNVSLQTGSYAVTQDSSQFAFLVTRTGGFKGAISVTYATANGTAIAGTDYTSSSGTLTWADGDSSVRTITVPWLDTSNYSGTKTFNINLSCSSSCPAALSPYASELVSVTDNLTPPSTKFTFNNATSNYYLGLPIDEYGGTGGANGAQFAWQTISDTTLATGFSDPYFYLNSSNQIVFTAPSNGATSSPGAGTNDTRSELREQYYGSGVIDTDDWDSSVGGTLTASCAVNATSVDTDEATIGQIHGQNNPFALLEYKPTSSTQGNIVLQVNSTNTSDSGNASYTIATGINLGAFITYELKLSGGSLTALVNGVSATTMPVTIDSSWVGACGGSSCTYDDGMYFKFGAYSGASNTGNPAGDETQVTFSSFSVTHP